ncbi:pol-like protein [Apostichopus japonicus]|uniref:Pol-like protein n=1 Tax=Stichopus japonicus TaxID=307972 RepID=A0A2G8KEB5_STIJA|nr:pol-like protein [Apostichopus japonicus]
MRSDASDHWELLKLKNCSASIKYSKLRAKERRGKERELIDGIAVLEQQLYTAESPEIRSQRKATQCELLSYYSYKLRGTIIRSRGRWVEEGEKNRKYFLNLEKRNKSLNSMHKLQSGDGHFLSDNNDILLEIKHEYKTLYSSSECFPNTFFNELPTQQVPVEDLASCDGQLSLENVLKPLPL